MREYKDYWVDLTVNGLTPDLAASETVASILLFGIRLQSVFLDQGDFSNTLGFRDREDILGRFVDQDVKPTFLKLNSQSDAARLGLIRELTFTIIPRDPTRIINPYNGKYNTGVPYNADVNIRTVVAGIYATQFLLGEGTNTATYIVLPGSVKEKKLKRTTPTFV